MANISLSKAILSVGFIAAAFFAYEAVTKNTVENLHTNKKLTESELSEQWKNGNVILLIRHEERCDRSSSPCLGPDSGITIAGSERARKTGNHLKAYFNLNNTDLFTSPTVRTVQTSDVMLGKASLLPNREAICGSDIIDKLIKHKTTKRNLIVVTHNTCMKDLIRASGHTHSWSPEYGSFLFAKITNENEIHVVGTLEADDLPQRPS